MNDSTDTFDKQIPSIPFVKSKLEQIGKPEPKTCDNLQKRYDRECTSRYFERHSSQYFLCQQIINYLRKCQTKR